jgi:hypothetical protein
VIAALLLLLPLAPVDDLAALDKKLKSSDERERRSAVIEVAKLDTKDAWLRVIDALADPSAQVADEAEIQLAKLHGPELVAELCGKRGLTARDGWVAAHAAGALGSLSGATVPAALLVPGLESKSIDVKRLLCASIQQLAESSQLGDASKLRGPLASVALHDDPEVRAAAMLAVWKIAGDEGLPAQAVSDRDPAPVLCARLQMSAQSSDEKAEQLRASCAQSADRSVREQVVDILAAKPDADALKTLVGMLEREKNNRLRDHIDAELERLSGVSGGGKAEFWREWVDHLGPEWKPATRDPKPREAQGDTYVAALAGMPIVSDHVVILVDFSGSTWKAQEGGKTRKDRLDVELKKTLEALPPGTSFNLIPYTDVPIPWEKSMQAATSANVAKALKFFTGCKASGKGNFWDAAVLALESPDVDTILVLTDGAPTGGHRWNVDLMRELYVERNRFRHVALDAVIVDAKKGMQERWRKFCEATGGRMLAEDL